MRHADVAGLGRVTEDVVASLHIPQLPAVGFEHLNDLFAVHGGYYNHPSEVVNTITTSATNKKAPPHPGHEVTECGGFGAIRCQCLPDAQSFPLNRRWRFA